MCFRNFKQTLDLTLLGKRRKKNLLIDNISWPTNKLSTRLEWQWRRGVAGGGGVFEFNELVGLGEIFDVFPKPGQGVVVVVGVLVIFYYKNILLSIFKLKHWVKGKLKLTIRAGGEQMTYRLSDKVIHGAPILKKKKKIDTNKRFLTFFPNYCIR